MSGPVLLTSNWPTLLDYASTSRASTKVGFVPVCTSVGTPRNAAWTRKIPKHSLITPYGLLGKWAREHTTEEWFQAYEARLEKAGVDAIQARFNEIAVEYPGLPLVLLCWEADRRDCHRGFFAKWWMEKTGIYVPEARSLDPLSIQASVKEATGGRDA